MPSIDFTPLRRLAAGAILAAALASAPNLPAHAADDEVVARVNGVEITRDDLAIAGDDILQSAPDLPEEEQEGYLITYLTDLELIAQAARAAGIADEEEFRKRMEYVAKRNLMEAYLARKGTEAVTDEAAQKLYDEVIEQVPPEERVNARHILVETEDEAKAIRDELEAGGDFAAIAAERSMDPGSKDEGGDLGWFSKEEMVPEFAEAAFALEPGQISEPVQSDFGWHIIKVEGKRDKPGFDEVREQIDEMLVRRMQRDIIIGLRETATIERLDDPADADGTDPEQDQE